jgi:hypothetical protein
MATEWINADSDSPKYGGFYWVKLASGKVELAYYGGNRFQTAETAGDREGLSVEYIEGVTHFRDVEEPVETSFGLTDMEKQALRHLEDFWNLYLELPGYDADDMRVIRDSVHTIQSIMAVRVAKRVDPEFWR